MSVIETMGSKDEMVVNAAGRQVLTEINGESVSPYLGAYEPLCPQKLASRIPPKTQPTGESKLISFEDAVGMIPKGGTFSIPHYYREGGVVEKAIVETLEKLGILSVNIFGNAFFKNWMPWLPEMVQKGVIFGIYGNRPPVY